jgi:hypothetical protein
MASGISVKECVALVIWCFQCVGFQSLMPTFDTVPVVHMTVCEPSPFFKRYESYIYII